MRSKERKLVITFPTTTAAMGMEDACRAEHMAGRLIPVPVSITAGCGLAWCAPLEERENLEGFMARKNIRSEGIYECLI